MDDKLLEKAKDLKEQINKVQANLESLENYKKITEDITT